MVRFGQSTAYRDAEFRPDESTIVEISDYAGTYTGKDIPRVVEWRRLKDLSTFTGAIDGRSTVRLFEDGVRASDINQGALGDCWLLSSLACLATRAGAVEKLFLTPVYNEDGRYQLRLWDKQAKRYKGITIDDCIPVWRKGGQPCFARPNGNEAWVLLLEKAMAKHVGSYYNLHGGMPAWALETLTGHYTCMFLLNSKYGPNGSAGRDPYKWRWLRAELVDVAGGRGVPTQKNLRYTFDPSDPKSFYTQDEMFRAAAHHLSIGNLVAASTEGDGDDSQDKQGVVQSHAYTATAAKEVPSKGRGQLLMIQVRNPHGAGGIEWTGDWSDRSTLWAKHPEVASAVGYTPPASVTAGPSTDGFFWMEWRDFVQHFRDLTFCCANGFDYVEDDGGDAVEAFNDASFPHDYRSLGDYKIVYNGRPTAGAQLDSLVKWMRLKEIAAPDQFRHGTRGLRLFSGGGTHPDDIDGSSGGLMVATACLANKPGAIEELFISGKEYRPDGAYQIRLYDPKASAASIEPIDDWIPCLNGTAITKTKILGSEVWVLLLEKAVARMLGSYNKITLQAVQVCWALACLTGEYTCRLAYEDQKKKWRRMELQYQAKTPDMCSMQYRPDDSSLVSSDDVFKVINTQLLLGCLVAADTATTDVVREATGLARGRSYSVLDAREVPLAGGKTGRLIKLRDPARQNEWKGDWGDASGLWDQNPAVAQAVGFTRDGAAVAKAAAPSAFDSAPRADGSFWMTFEDFLLYFRTLTLCGNSLRNNAKPWVAPQADLDRAARRLAEARRQQSLRAEQEALEDSLVEGVRQKAHKQAMGAEARASGQVFAQAAMSASAPKPQGPPLPVPQGPPKRLLPPLAAAAAPMHAKPAPAAKALPTLPAAPAAPVVVAVQKEATPKLQESAPAKNVTPISSSASPPSSAGDLTEAAAAADEAKQKPSVAVVDCKVCSITWRGWRALRSS